MCVHTLTCHDAEGNILKSSEKNTIFNELPLSKETELKIVYHGQPPKSTPYSFKIHKKNRLAMLYKPVQDIQIEQSEQLEPRYLNNLKRAKK